MPFYGLPLYAYFLAGLYWLFGYSPFIPGVIQAGLDGGTAVIIYKLAGRGFWDRPRGKRASWISVSRRGHWYPCGIGMGVLRAGTNLLCNSHADGRTGFRFLVRRLAGGESTGADPSEGILARHSDWVHGDGSRNRAVSGAPFAGCDLLAASRGTEFPEFVVIGIDSRAPNFRGIGLGNVAVLAS